MTDNKQIQHKLKGSDGSESTLTAYSGSLVAPETAEYWDRISPGAAEKILNMGMSEQNFRHEIERGKLSSVKRGQLLSFAIAIILPLMGTVLIYLGHNVGGLVAIVTPIVGALGVSLTGAYVQTSTQKKH